MFLKGINDSQKQAVMTTEGPMLIIAGPGTGKTLTIIHRLAYLINQGVKPENIFAITFTNRAAKEIKERAGTLLGRNSVGVFIGTFHLLGLRILKDMLTGNFVIYNRDKQVNLLKPLMQGSITKAQQAADRISRIKNFLGDMDDEIKEVYEKYQSELMKNSALDFDDLILKPIEILSSDVAGKYMDSFNYIMVDEYQDINPAQYKLLRLLAHNKSTLCVIGDSDQAIYAFRGADVKNFLNFEKDFEDSKRITLTENYRSTGVILNASNAVIKNNLKRIDKELKPQGEKGQPINIISVPNEKTEGEIIVKEIEKRIGGTSHYQLMQPGISKNPKGCSYSFSDFAIIFRTNAQAKAIEDAFSTSGIPYQIIGKSGNLQRKEIEDTISYLKAVINSNGSTNYYSPSVLDEASLLTPADFFDSRADAVTLMTLHMAKGLEFRVVFIAGVEDGLIPYTMKKDSTDIEEERRLFYVGMTRAKDELFLIHARKRFIYGQRFIQPPSPFIKEIPEEFTEYRFIPDKTKRFKKDNQAGLF
ncbi:MAG: UvrD-helicase domain-containing protein [Nitrospirota bacterium]